MMENTKAWKLFRSMFKDGDEVVIIDENDKITYGKMAADEIGVTLVRRLKTSYRLPWEDIRFMSHDGFPVRKLFGADGSRLVERLDTQPTVKSIRETLVRSICSNCKRLMAVKTPTWGNERPNHLNDMYHSHRDCGSSFGGFGFGDPFQIDPVEARIVNPGNSGEEYWGEDDEELILLTAKDGAKGILADLSSVFFAEFSQCGSTNLSMEV